jgi:two-component system OmpR family sensor kinase
VSLRSRLLLAAAAMVLLALVAADVATYSQLRSYLYNQVDANLDANQTRVGAALDRGVLGSAYIEVRYPDRHLVAPRTDNSVTPRLPAQVAVTAPAQGERVIHFNVPAEEPGGPTFRVSWAVFYDGTQVIVAVPLSDVERTLHHQAKVDLAVTALALIGVAVLGFWLVQLSLRPLKEMEATAAAIAEGDLGRRIPGDAEATEVGRLARTLNVMMTRIQDAFAARDATENELRQSEERLRRFVADASHELRTPVAAIGAYAELFERGASGRPEDLARVLSGIRSETERMGELVEDLLLLARLDEGRPLEQESVELVGLAAEAVDAAGAVGPAWPVRLEANQTVEVTGDAARLRQVLDNLLANVRAHTPPGTSTAVRVGARDGSGVVEVSDNGPGLAGESGTRVFERFYRADPSRSRQNGGAGLGLAIVAAIVAAHGGSVAASETPGGGATFTVWLPSRRRAEPAPASGGNGAAAPAHVDAPAVASKP